MAFDSLAVFGNLFLLALGGLLWPGGGDYTRPYGYGLEQYVWTMVSGVSMFILGAGATVSHGFHALYHPEPLASVPVALGVLGAAGLLEGYTLSVAWAEVKAEAAGGGLKPEYANRKGEALNKVGHGLHVVDDVFRAYCDAPQLGVHDQRAPMPARHRVQNLPERVGHHAERVARRRAGHDGRHAVRQLIRPVSYKHLSLPTKA